MNREENKPALLLLQDGTLFSGKSCGAIGTTGGEICFNTGMTGYQEIFTDPSYFGQIMVMSNVHIGNYGAFEQDNESSKVYINGLVCRNFSSFPSRPLANSSLQEYLETNHIVGISDIDTRKLVSHIRQNGLMNAVISSEIFDIDALKHKLNDVPNMSGLELASQVTTNQFYDYRIVDGAKKLAVLDFGIKKSILEQLAAFPLTIRVFPAKSSFDELQNWQPDAFFLSNGPGDPAPMSYAIELTKQLISTKKPIFGICLGHQILSLAFGVNTYKMHHGHHGVNHPVLNLETGLGEISSQNHGFAVDNADLQTRTELMVTHRNLNDDTVEGIRHITLPVFGIQYHPEAGPGPHDSRYLFKQFFQSIDSGSNN